MSEDSKSKMPLTKKGIMLMIAGFLVMLAGYIFLIGGGPKNPNVFNYEMFDFQRLYVAPIVIICGIVIEIIAIMGGINIKKRK